MNGRLIPFFETKPSIMRSIEVEFAMGPWTVFEPNLENHTAAAGPNKKFV